MYRTRQRVFLVLCFVPSALHICPGDALTYKRRADVRGKMSRREEAIEDYKKAIVIQTSLRQQ